MTRLVWGDKSSRRYQAGVDRGVFYTQDGMGRPWNGLLSIFEGAEPSETAIFLDGVKIDQRRGSSSFFATLEAYTNPEELDLYLNYEFGLSYRVQIAGGYQIHLVYNAKAQPKVRSRQTRREAVEGTIFGWDLTTMAERVEDSRRTAHLIIDSTIAGEDALAALEDVLYGDDENEAALPTPDMVVSIFEENAVLRVIDNGDGTYTIEGPDEAMLDNGDGTWEITWPSALNIDEDTFQISSL